MNPAEVISFRKGFPAMPVVMLLLLAVYPCKIFAKTGLAPINLIVQLKAPAAVAYSGGVQGFPGTHGLFARASGSSASQRAAAASSPGVTAYAAHLMATSRAVVADSLGAAAVGNIRAFYTLTLAGFAIPLASVTGKQLRTIKKHPAVASAEPEAVFTPNTITTQTFLDLATPGGVWAQLGGLENSGEDIIIGVMDSGIWPESASFSDRKDLSNNSNSEPAYGPVPSSFLGACEAGEDFEPAKHCNLKLIGCRAYYNQIFGSAEEMKKVWPDEYASCRDSESHGTHTSSTAGGNYGIPSPFDQFPGTITGMAPKARNVMYKVCYGEGCYGSAIVGAADHAVKDGVSIINFSLGGPTSSYLSADEVFWKNVAAAGIFAAASAGNAGPGPSTVENLSPWVTTVAAGRHTRFGNASVTLGNGFATWGASTNKEGVGPAPLVLAENVALKVNGTFDVEAARLCSANTLDPELTAGKIVVCDRSGQRPQKSYEVRRAGGVGCIIVDVGLAGTSTQVHYVPTVHLSGDNRDSLRAYAAQAGATATLGVATLTFNLTAPVVIDFSSRGPSPLGEDSVMKPDIIGPGVDILAAVVPPAEFGRAFEMYSGTSMSSPTLAGLAALVRQKHPTWSPMAVKSALMTTAYQTTRTGSNPGQVFGKPFDFGAGHVDTPAALNPGLVIDSDLPAWNRFLCGLEVPVNQWSSNSMCANVCDAKAPEVCDPVALNSPYVAAAVTGKRLGIKRTLTSVLTEAATFTTDITASGGLVISTRPTSFTLAPGASQEVEIDLDVATTNSVPLDTYVDGAITWTSSLGTKTRIPVIAKSTLFIASKAFTLYNKDTIKQLSFNVVTGYSGTLSTITSGLQPAKVYANTIVRANNTVFPINNPAPEPGIVPVDINLPAAARTSWSYVRFALYNDDVPAQLGVDLDMYVYKDGALVGIGGGITAQEYVNLENPAPGKYTVWIHGFKVPQMPDGNPMPFKLHVYHLYQPGPIAVNVKSSPASNKPAVATAGSPVMVKLDFTSRVSKGRWLGAVLYGRDPQKGATGQAGIAQRLPKYTLIAIE